MSTANQNELVIISSQMRRERVCHGSVKRRIPITVLLYAACLGTCLGVGIALGLLSYSPSKRCESESKTDQNDVLGAAASLGGILFLEKSHRLALHWEKGDFELWDTEHGRRLGRVERLPRTVGWCVASPDESTILTADRMPTLLDSAELSLQLKGFTPSISIWETKSGARKHLVQVPEASGDRLYFHEWYARWMDSSHALLVRVLRENPSRAACRLRLIVIDTIAGKVAKASAEFKSAGEHLFLSPKRKMALVKDDNYMCRAKDGKGVGGMYRNNYARTHIFDLAHLTIICSWREPPDTPGGEEEIALIARWCPDGNTVITVSDGWSDDHPAPKARLWDVRSGRLLQTFSGHKDHILDIALTSTGDKLLTASEDRTVRVWDTRTGSLEAVLTGHRAGLNKVIVLPGNKLAVSAAEEPVVKLWDLNTRKLKFNLRGHDSAVRDLEAVSDNIVKTTTLRGTVTTWDCATGKQLRITPKKPVFPKRFGVCELIEEGGKLYMRVGTKK